MQAAFSRGMSVPRPIAKAISVMTSQGETAWPTGWAPRNLDPAGGATRDAKPFTAGEAEQDAPTIGVVIGNETDRPVALWLEPLCDRGKVAPDQTSTSRAPIIGGPGADAAGPATVFDRLTARLKGGARGPEPETSIDADTEGRTWLRLWLDRRHDLPEGGAVCRPMQSGKNNRSKGGG